MSNSFDPRNITNDRLSTTDDKGKRLYVHPAETHGKYRNRRKLVNFFLIFIFLIAPWIKIHGNPLILIDLIHRKFSFFGIQFWAHEAPMLVFFFLGFALTIAFITSVWGRMWCGWACPQTVFIVGVYRRIESLIEGDNVKRRQLDSAPWDFDKTFKRLLKWFIFILVSMVISHSFLAYFIEPKELMRMIKSSPALNPESFMVMAFVTTVIAFDFGWFREQFCIIMCPYGRFQSVLMDDSSQAIIYDTKRGEPRIGSEILKQNPEQSSGDCINCFKCVQVCPTGIDIRRGVQMECIACTACIDACNDVMTKTKKPLGLIRYSSKSEIENNISHTFKQKILKPRSLVYIFLLIAVTSSLTLLLSIRKPIDIDVLRSKESPYQLLTTSNGVEMITNHFKMDIRNRSIVKMISKIKLIDLDAKLMNAEIISQNTTFEIDEGSEKRADFFIKFPKTGLNFGHAKAKVEIETTFLNPNVESMRIDHEELKLVGPSN